MTVKVFGAVGSGGQATVHKAQDHDGTQIAVKILKEEYLSTPDYVERFNREIQIMQKLDHPGIVKVQPLRLNTGRPAYVMPWAEGSLQKEIDDNPWGLPEARVLDVYRSVLDAIEFAHRENVLHRDIKPDNVLYVDGIVQVSDFGLARTMDSIFSPLTQSHVRVGTDGYAAPEVWAGGAKYADVAADIYSLGALLFHLFSVQHPASGIDIGKVPSQYRDLIVRATDVNPARRYSNVTDLIAALELRQGAAQQHLQVPEDTALGLITSFQQGNTSAAGELGHLLCDHEQDSQLYLNIVPKIPGPMIRQMELQGSGVLTRVLEAFYVFLDRQHAFATTDSYGAFLHRAWTSIEDVPTKLSILRPLLLLAWSHNRYQVRTLFVKVAAQAARKTEFVYGICDILRENPEAKAFVREELLQQPIPQLIKNILDEEPPADHPVERIAWW